MHLYPQVFRESVNSNVSQNIKVVENIEKSKRDELKLTMLF